MCAHDMYVYLSDAKLRTLIPNDPRWWARVRARRVKAGLQAGGAQVSVDLETDKLLRLGAQISKAEGQASVTGKWYEDETLTAGDWMFFEGRIGCHVVDLQPSPGAVLFCQIPSGQRRLLVLHGSARHLLGSSPAEALPLSVTSPFSQPSEFPNIVRRISSPNGDPIWRFWRLFDNQATPHHRLHDNLIELYRNVVDTDWFRASAPYLAGCALVSAVTPGPDGTEIAVGSPLFVRHARPGSSPYPDR